MKYNIRMVQYVITEAVTRVDAKKNQDEHCNDPKAPIVS